MVGGGGTPHLVPPDVSRDVLVERRQFSVTPVFVQDVEFQRVALDFEVVQRRHGVGVVAGPADHAAELVAHLLNDEVLLGRAHCQSPARPR